MPTPTPRLLLALTTLLVACSGWAARELYAAVRSSTVAVHRLEASHVASERSLVRLAEQFERAWRRIEDHERRIALGEANAFAAGDAQFLATSVARLAVLNQQLSKDIDGLSTQLATLQRELQHLRETMIRHGTLKEADR